MSCSCRFRIVGFFGVVEKPVFKELCNSGDIFQDRVYDLIGDVERIKTYIVDIVVLIKDIFYKHIENLQIVFSQLFNAGLKVDAPK